MGTDTTANAFGFQNRYPFVIHHFNRFHRAGINAAFTQAACVIIDNSQVIGDAVVGRYPLLIHLKGTTAAFAAVTDRLFVTRRVEMNMDSLVYQSFIR